LWAFLSDWFTQVCAIAISSDFITELPNSAPSGEVDAIALFKRKKPDNHRVTVYSDMKCLGTPLLDVVNFVCDKVCHTLPQGALSVQLHQERKSDPDPVALMFYATNCTGTSRNARTRAGQTDRCKNLNRHNDGISNDTAVWMSARLDYGC